MANPEQELHCTEEFPDSTPAAERQPVPQGIGNLVEREFQLGQVPGTMEPRGEDTADCGEGRQQLSRCTSQRDESANEGGLCPSNEEGNGNSDNERNGRTDTSLQRNHLDRIDNEGLRGERDKPKRDRGMAELSSPDEGVGPSGTKRNNRRKPGATGTSSDESDHQRPGYGRGPTDDGTADYQTTVVHISADRLRFERGARPPSFIIADHGDHQHFIWNATNGNRQRGWRRIAKYIGLDPVQTREGISAIQRIRSTDKFAQYLVRVATTGENILKCFGKSKPMLEYWNTLMEYTGEELEGCINWMDEKRELRRSNKLETKMTNVMTRENQWEYARTMVKDKRKFTIAAFERTLLTEDVKQLYMMFGTSWKGHILMAMTEVKSQRLREEFATPYFARIQQLADEGWAGCVESTCTHGQDNDWSEEMSWLEKLFNANRILTRTILQAINDVMDSKFDKINTLVFQGATNTGKSLLANLITDNLLVGLVSRASDQSAFAFQNLVNKRVALFEEPRITQQNVNDMKLLLGGEKSLDVQVKHQDSEPLPRTPVIITTNDDLGQWVPSTDAEPLHSRTITFRLTERICQARQTDLGHGRLKEPEHKICQCAFAALAKKYGF